MLRTILETRYARHITDIIMSTIHYYIIYTKSHLCPHISMFTTSTLNGCIYSLSYLYVYVFYVYRKKHLGAHHVATAETAYALGILKVLTGHENEAIAYYSMVSYNIFITLLLLSVTFPLFPLYSCYPPCSIPLPYICPTLFFHPLSPLFILTSIFFLFPFPPIIRH